MTKKVIIDPNRSYLQNTLRIAWPAVMESVFISLLNMVDTWMVSGIGAVAVVAVGLTNQPRLVIMTVFFALGTTCSTLVARRAGEDNQEGANRILCASLAAVVAFYILICGLAIVFARPIMNWCGAKPDTIEGSVTYFRVICGGLIFSNISLVINAAQRAVGNTAIALVTNVAANLVNIVFNYLLIDGHFGFPALGVKGAAIATIMGSAVGCVLSVIAACKAEGFISMQYILRMKNKFSLSTLLPVINTAKTLFAENVMQRIGHFITAVITARLGTGPFAAYQVGMNILNIAFAFGEGLQTTAIALVGFTLGQGKKDEAKKYTFSCLKIGFCISAVFSAVSLLFGRQIFMMFFKEEELINMGVIISRFFAGAVLFLIVQIVCSGSLRGGGDVKFMFLTTTIAVTVVQPILTWFFALKLGWGIAGIWAQILLMQILRLALVGGRLMTGKWMDMKV